MQKPFIFTSLVVALLLASVTAAAPQSLADVARAEQARRKTITGQAKVYTNEDLGKGDGVPAPPPATGTPANSAMPPAPAATGARPAAVKPAEAPPAAAGQDEKYWRTRITDAKTAVQRSQAFHDALQSQINGLYTEFVAMGDPARRAVIEKRRLAAIAEQDRLKAEIAKQTKAIADIEDEARRAGAPPGWLR